MALANMLESVVRDHGGVPATIALLDGVARVGLDALELERLLSAKKLHKISRRDFACILGDRESSGGTTISGTMILARRAGIKVFATGGLGGVHRGVERTMDVSADLTELGRTPVAVVSSGCKGFLDIPRTLEFLETQGVPIGVIRDDQSSQGPVDFPAFWSRQSGMIGGFAVDVQVAAQMIYAQESLDMQNGILFANPIPAEDEIPREVMQPLIEEAILLSQKMRVNGWQNTPFILDRIRELTNGKSVLANKSLVANNAKIGTLIAKELLKLESPPIFSDVYFKNPRPDNVSRAGDSKKDATKTSAQEKAKAGILVAGSLAVDFSCNYSPFSSLFSSTLPPFPLSPEPGTSNPAAIASSLGGVGYNVAKAAHLLGASVKLCSVVGKDMMGDCVLHAVRADGMRMDGVFQPTEGSPRTAQYVALNSVRKDLMFGMADMTIFEELPPSWKETWEAVLRETCPSWIVVDSNWSDEMLHHWLDQGKRSGAKTIFEPVSGPKSARLFPRLSNKGPFEMGLFPDHKVDIATPNQLELATMHQEARDRGYLDSPEWFRIIDSLGMPTAGTQIRILRASSKRLVKKGVPQQAIQLLPFIPCIVTTLGEDGVLLTMLLDADDWRFSLPAARKYIVSRSNLDDKKVRAVYMRHFAPPKVLDANKGEIAGVNGAGDTFLGALVAKMAKDAECPVENAILFAQEAALLTLQSSNSVSERLSSLKIGEETDSAGDPTPGDK